MKRALMIGWLSCCGLPLLSFSQTTDPLPATLLWRISSPAIKNPSYLFGTMHLQDKRLFNFSDSLYASIRSVEGFAAELDMDDMNDMVAVWFNSQPSSDEPAHLLKNIINVSLRKKYQSALVSKFKKPFNSITLEEVKAAADNWQSSARKEDDMPTFVDVYLYGLAKRENKWIGALENLEDQADEGPVNMEAILQQALVSDKLRRAEMEKYIEIYLSENLSRMHELVETSSGAYDTWKMNFRNKNMVHKMDSLAAIRSCFYAVGAAHLPGDSGLIQLLRNKGYNVEPVISESRLSPDEYLSKYSQQDWQKTSLANGDFDIDMPGAASEIDGKAGFQQAKLFFDPLSMSGFLSGYIPLHNFTEKAIDSTCKQLPQFYAREGRVISDSIWTINGRKGYQVEASTKDGFINLVAHPVAGGIVLNMIVSMSEAGMKMNNAATYFNSFVVHRKTGPPPITGWRKQLNERKQLSYEIPIKLEKVNSPAADSSWATEALAGVDPITQNYYFINSMENTMGFYSNSDSLYFDEVRTNQKTGVMGKLLDFSMIQVDGFPGCSMLLAKKINKDSVYYRFLIINRGNRRYTALVGYYPGAGGEGDASRFIKGIRFTPYKEQKTVKGNPPYENFSLQSPNIFKLDENLMQQGTKRYISYDSTSAVTMHIDIGKLDEYYGSSTDSATLMEQAGNLYEQPDSLIQFSISYKDGFPVADGVVQLQGTHNQKRFRILVTGDTLFALVAVVSPEVGNAAAYTKMFNSFSIRSYTKNSYAESKAREVFRDLLLPDSLIFNDAKNALNWVKIDAGDIPLLQQAVLHPMIDFSERSYCTHDVLINRLADMNDTGTPAFVANSYPKLADRNTILQYPLLSLLAKAQTVEQTRLMLDLMASGLPKEGNAGLFYDALADSMELAKLIFPFILEHKEDSLLRKILPRFLLDMELADMLEPRVFEELKPTLQSLTREYLQEQRLKNVPMPVYFNSLVEILIRYDDAASLELLDSLSLHRNEDIQFNTVLVQLEKGKIPLEKTVQALANDPFFRTRMFELLQEAGKESMFPDALRKQRFLAESHLFREIWDDYQGFDLQFLKETTQKLGGKKKKLYLFKVSYPTADGQVEYLGVAGPYSSKSKLDAVDGEWTGVYYEEIYEASRVQELLDAFILSQQ